MPKPVKITDSGLASFGGKSDAVYDIVIYGGAGSAPEESSVPAEPEESETPAPEQTTQAPASVGPIQFNAELSTDKRYTATLHLNVAAPMIILGEPGKVTVETGFQARPLLENTTVGGRSATVGGQSLGDLRLWYQLPVALQKDGVSRRCPASATASSTAPWLFVKMPFAYQARSLNGNELPGGETMELSAFDPTIWFGFGGGGFCVDEGRPMFDEDLQAELEQVLAGGPTFIELTAGGFVFADGVSNNLCSGRQNTVQQTLDSKEQLMTAKQASAAPVGSCTNG